MAKKPPTHGNVRRGASYVGKFLLVRGTRRFKNRKKHTAKYACRRGNTPLSERGMHSLTKCRECIPLSLREGGGNSGQQIAISNPHFSKPFGYNPNTTPPLVVRKDKAYG